MNELFIKNLFLEIYLFIKTSRKNNKRNMHVQNMLLRNLIIKYNLIKPAFIKFPENISVSGIANFTQVKNKIVYKNK